MTCHIAAASSSIALADILDRSNERIVADSKDLSLTEQTLTNTAGNLEDVYSCVDSHCLHLEHSEGYDSILLFAAAIKQANRADTPRSRMRWKT